MHGAIFVEYLRKNMLAIDCNYVKNFTILKCKKAPKCKFILTSFK